MFTIRKGHTEIFETCVHFSCETYKDIFSTAHNVYDEEIHVFWAHGVIQLSQETRRAHVWLQDVMIAHWQGAKMATGGWGWLGSVAASGPWPRWEWTMSEGNWGAALEGEGPPRVLVLLLFTDCSHTHCCQRDGWRDSEGRERGKRKEERGKRKEERRREEASEMDDMTVPLKWS